MIDLESLKDKFTKTTGGVWFVSGGEVQSSSGIPVDWERNVSAVVAIRNAFPRIIGELEAWKARAIQAEGEIEIIGDRILEFEKQVTVELRCRNPYATDCRTIHELTGAEEFCDPCRARAKGNK